MGGSISEIRLCDSCVHCKTLNTKEGKVKTSHFSGEEYEWDKYAEPICKLLGVGMRNVSKCDHHKVIDKKSVN